MKIKSSQLKKLIRESLRTIYEAAKDYVCPRATQDLEYNTKKRNKAIKAKHIKYGPLNLSDENYWNKLSDHWNTDVDVAKKSLCGNCAAFDVTKKMQACMGVKSEYEKVTAEFLIKNNKAGYCKMHDFSCAAEKTCLTWAPGGPKR